MEQNLRSAWPLFVMPFVIVLTGLLLGKLVAWITSCPSDFNKACMGAVGFANSSSMAVVLLGAISPPLLEAKVITKDPLLFLALYLVVYPMLEWTLGAYLFKPKPRDVEEGEAKPETAETTAQSNETSASNNDAPCLERRPTLEAALPADLALATEGDLMPCDVETCSSNAKLEKLRGYGAAVRKVIRNALVPPVRAVLVGMVIVSIPILHQGFVITHEGQTQTLVGFTYRAAATLGGAMAPCSSLVLGANLFQGVKIKSIPIATNLGISVAKLVIMPAIMAVVVWGLSHALGPNGNGGAEWLVVLIVSCTPTANKIMVMVELSGENKAGMSAAIFVQYALAPVFLTLALFMITFLLQSEWYLPRELDAGM